MDPCLSEEECRALFKVVKWGSANANLFSDKSTMDGFGTREEKLKQNSNMVST